MKIFQLIDWITRLFKLNKKAKTVTLLLLSYSMYGQNNAMFWGSQFNKATTTTVGSDKVTTFTAGTGNIQFN